MTPFETIMIICAVLIVLLVGWLCVLTRNHYMLTQSREFTMQEFHRTLKHTNGVLSHIQAELGESIVTDVHIAKEHLFNIIINNREYLKSIQDILDKMHKNICVDVAEKMVDRAFPIKEGEPLDAAFEPDYKLKKDIECKLNGFAAAVLDAECCTKEIVDFWLERICDAAHKYIKHLKIDWDKLSKEQQDEFLKRLICPDCDNPFKSSFEPLGATTWPPCYWGGLCTNPHHDCINCPRPSTTGVYTTSNKVETTNDD